MPPWPKLGALTKRFHQLGIKFSEITLPKPYEWLENILIKICQVLQKDCNSKFLMTNIISHFWTVGFHISTAHTSEERSISLPSEINKGLNPSGVCNKFQQFLFGSYINLEALTTNFFKTFTTSNCKSQKKTS